MRLEDLEHVPVTYEHQLNARAERLRTMETHLKEAFDQVTLPKDKQSQVILKHRLERLDSKQLCELRDMVLTQRVIESGNFDDLLLEPSYKGAIGSPGKRGALTTEADLANRGPIEVPDKIFVFDREDLKPYKRLSTKFTKMFAAAYHDFKKFKEDEIANFARTTQMTLQVSADCDVIKQVIETNQANFDEFEAKLNPQLRVFDERMANLEDLLEKKVNKCMVNISKNHKIIEKVQATSLTTTSKIDLVYQKMEAFETEVEKFKKSISSLLIAQEKSMKRMNTMAITMKNHSSINVGAPGNPTDRSR